MSIAKQFTAPIDKSSLALSAIMISGGTQSREKISPSVVKDYAEAISPGTKFPPVVVFYDGDRYWLADGFHRFHAHKDAGKKSIAVDVRQGTQREAILFSVGANSEHGLRRTNDDKRRAVLTLLNDPEWGRWTDREIARKASVSQPFVTGLRPAVTDNVISDQRTFTTKHGTVGTMNTGGINAGRNAYAAAKSGEDKPITPPYSEVKKAAAVLSEFAGITPTDQSTAIDVPVSFGDFIDLIDKIEAIPIDALVKAAGGKRSVLNQRASGLADRMDKIMGFGD